MMDPLEAMAQRAEAMPYFLAPLLVAFAQSEGIDQTALAGALGCAERELSLLKLCRAPREGPAFREDIVRIAERFALDPIRLAEAVKRGRVIVAMRQCSAGKHFQAARDRDEEADEDRP